MACTLIVGYFYRLTILMVFFFPFGCTFKIETNRIFAKAQTIDRKWSVLQKPSKMRPPTQLTISINVRDWKDNDFIAIRSLLQSSESGFDPEGPLDLDCGAQSTLRESYNPMDGGCFLVATKVDNSSEILGTAALISGTPITYFSSGTSVSSPEKVTGAVRRTCSVEAKLEDQELILQSLLAEIEKRAAKAGVTELIVLAYECSSRLNPSLLVGLGYDELLTKLPNVDASQYRKVLPLSDNSDDVTSKGLKKRRIGSNVAAIISIFGVGAALVFAITVANVMGFELIPSNNDNRGIGTPLSTQELQILKEEEQLQRTDIDSQQTKEIRNWNDLSSEEKREEAALMKVIQGQDVRLK
mmetsp:Transcript_33261/g.50167  ORF Transcript_33261/g.50167 Transcript_33261/m.50167 type:complete len:356 (-) Transcript_33261:2170-3237(-)